MEALTCLATSFLNVRLGKVTFGETLLRCSITRHNKTVTMHWNQVMKNGAFNDIPEPLRRDLFTNTREMDTILKYVK